MGGNKGKWNDVRTWRWLRAVRRRLHGGVVMLPAYGGSWQGMSCVYFLAERYCVGLTRHRLCLLILNGKVKVMGEE